MKTNIETIKQKVWQNSLNTCEYVSGYENSNSIILVHCTKHNKDFYTKWENVRRDNRAHLICPDCLAEQKELNKMSNREELVCAYCGKSFFRLKSKMLNSKSGLYFCCREHKDLAQTVQSGEKFKDMRPEHYNNSPTKSSYRKFAFLTYQHKCAICGWDEDEDLLEVHHIDENRENNDLTNLIILCPLCHRKLTCHKYKIINRTKIVKCE